MRFSRIRLSDKTSCVRPKEIVAAFAPADRVRELALAAWSLVHGYATLCIELALEPVDRRAARARAESDEKVWCSG
jgi:hypothetical protein